MDGLIPYILLTLFAAGGTTLLVVSVVAILLLKNPEKIEKWASIIYKMQTNFRGLFKSAHRNYVKHDLQSRINSFVKETSRTAPYLEDIRIAIEWVDSTIDQKTFLNNGKAVIRLSRNDPEDLNFVRGAYWSVSTRLLPKVKRYISPSQRQALDLYVTSRLIEAEKFTVIEQFLEHFLHSQIDNDGKIASLYAQLERIDRYGAFYPILLQELYFLSLKVYGGQRNDHVIQEVSRLVDFLLRVASRSTGEHIDMNFLGDYCRFGIVIVGTGEKMSLEGREPYIGYVNKVLRAKKVETIYVLGKSEYREFIDGVCSDLYMDYEEYRSHDYVGTITRSDGSTSVSVNQHLVVLRSLDTPLYQPGVAK